MQEIFVLEGCQMNYVKYLDLINYGKQATTTVFTETLVHAFSPTTLLKTQVFSFSYCEIFKDSFFIEHLW